MRNLRLSINTFVYALTQATTMVMVLGGGQMKRVHVVTGNTTAYRIVMQAVSRVHSFDMVIKRSATYSSAVKDIESIDPPLHADVAVLDLYLTGVEKGIELAQMLRKRLSTIGIIFFARDVEKAHEAALTAGITSAAFVEKPHKIADGDLLGRIEAALVELTDVNSVAS